MLLRSASSSTLPHLPKDPLSHSSTRSISLSRAVSDTDLISLSRSKPLKKITALSTISVAEERDVFSIGSGVLEDECVGGGSGGGCWIGNGGGGEDECGDGADLYYRSMIEANPGNGLILGNYAKYLKEV